MQRPEAARDFSVKLTGTPDHHARKIARIVRRLFDDAVDQLRVIDEEQPLPEAQGARARCLGERQDRDNRFEQERSAKVDRIEHHLRRGM